MWNKIVTWIKEHLEYISIFRIVFYVSILILLTLSISYGIVFDIENFNKMKQPFSKIWGICASYIYFYLIFSLITSAVDLIGDFFEGIGNYFSKTYEDINNSKDENKSDKNTVLLRTIKYLLFLITIILSIILWKIW